MTIRLLTIDGETLTQRDWCARLGMSETTVSYRIRAGWPVAQALGLQPHFGNWRHRPRVAPPSRAARSVFELAEPYPMEAA